MLRSRALRFLTTLWAFWFAAALAEPASLVACQMHSPRTASEAVAQHHMSHGEHSGGGTEHRCSCLGECSSAAAASLPASRIELPGAPGQPFVAPLPAPRVVATTQIAYRLPFANGPPVVVS